MGAFFRAKMIRNGQSSPDREIRRAFIVTAIPILHTARPFIVYSGANFAPGWGAEGNLSEKSEFSEQLMYPVYRNT